MGITLMDITLHEYLNLLNLFSLHAVPLAYIHFFELPWSYLIFSLSSSQELRSACSIIRTSECHSLPNGTKVFFYCQTLVPIPVPLDSIPIPNSSPKAKGKIGTGADTKITWLSTTHNFSNWEKPSTSSSIPTHVYRWTVPVRSSTWGSPTKLWFLAQKFW